MVWIGAEHLGENLSSNCFAVFFCVFFFPAPTEIEEFKWYFFKEHLRLEKKDAQNDLC